MKERDIQDYLFLHPEVLFPSGKITEKASEYSIQGKRIDLLFVVDGFRYIVEIKKVPIQREHIGQVVEYYGLMKTYMQDAGLKMILVSPSIPEWRSAYLEELGIRCVEIGAVPSDEQEVNRIRKSTVSYQNREKDKQEIVSILNDGAGVSFFDIAGPTTPRGMAFARRMLQDTLVPIKGAYDSYDVMPFCIARSNSPHYYLEYNGEHGHGKNVLGHCGVWWAYRFGFSEDMKRNDVPNISIISNITGLDIIVNAELQPSQKALRLRIEKDLSAFDHLLQEHGGLWLKTYLKYEHQPRAYQWVLADLMAPGEFDGKTILSVQQKHGLDFSEERAFWLNRIIEENHELSEKQIAQLRDKNKTLNLAIRLVYPFKRDASIWSMDLKGQRSEIVEAVNKMKPLIDFFVR